MFARGSAARRTGEWICSKCRHAQQQQQQHQPRSTPRRHLASQPASSRRDVQQSLPGAPARTRFAPSPTGYLHLGSLRTALFNYLIAKATKGQFLLRIEDTDTKRTVPGAEERICSDLAWAGLQWDEGPQVGGPYGPYKQSERTEIYREHADRLLDSGHAYRCFCTAERLNELAQQRAKLGLPTDYDRTCASIAKEESDDRAHKGEGYTVRLKVPTLYPEYHDIVYGRVGKKQKPGSMRKHGETVYEDPILLKSDGLPTYHLANVVDDHLMEITHVVRAAEWMPSTPKHLALYEAFGWTAPAFAHVGLLQDNKGNKLSKRNADIDLDSYRNRGIFPEALANFSALLGWSHTRGDDFMTMQDLIDSFSFKFTKGNTVVTFKKLDYLQKLHGKRYIQEGGDVYNRMLNDVLSRLESETDPNWTLLSDDKDKRTLVAALLAADAQKSGYESAEKFLDSHQAFFVKQIERQKRSTLNASLVADLDKQLKEKTVEKWDAETVKIAIDTVVASNLAKSATADENSDAEHDLRNQIAKYLRWAVFSRPGPPIVESLALLGRETALARLEEAASLAETG